MKKHTLTKEVLQGYLFDGVKTLKKEADTNDFIFTGSLSDSLAGALSTSAKSVNCIKHSDIAAAFVALNNCRKAFQSYMTEIEEQERQAREERERQEQEERERAERSEKAAEILPYISINHNFIINHFQAEEGADKRQVSRQLTDAPLFSEISSSDIYMKRHNMNYAATNGADALELKAVEFSDFLTRFFNEVRRAANSAWAGEWKGNPYRYDWSMFFESKSNMLNALQNNKIDSEWMEKLGVRSPKFSKFLIKAFGEKATVVRMFNDRPSADELSKQEHEEVEGLKVVMSNLASNVMKMTADNAFGSCQNYTYTDFDSLEHLSCLPSSVNDETMSIAYICGMDEDIMHPYMKARILIKTMEFQGKLFLYGFNAYGNSEYIKLIHSSLRAAYGDRYIWEGDNYHNGNMYTFTHEYDYDVAVSFDAAIERSCYLCEGDGEVTATVRWTDYEFTTECPECEGSGESDEPDYENFESYPYINGSRVGYGFQSCDISVNRDLLESSIDTELQALEKETAVA